MEAEEPGPAAVVSEEPALPVPKVPAMAFPRIGGWLYQCPHCPKVAGEMKYDPNSGGKDNFKPSHWIPRVRVTDGGLSGVIYTAGK